MTEQIVAGMWGPRPESPQQIGQRLEVFLDRLSDVSSCYANWRETLETDDPGPAVSLDAAALTRSIVARNTEDDAEYFGYRLALLIWRGDEPAVELAAHAGGIAGRVPNVVSLAVRPEAAAADGADRSRIVVGLREALVALADTWDVDHGTIYHHDLIDALENEFDLKNSDPRCGRAVYLSRRRVERGVPEELAGTRIPTRHGGLVLDLAGSNSAADEAAGAAGADGVHRAGNSENGVHLDLTTVVEANVALRSTGALASLPDPMDRPKL